MTSDAQSSAAVSAGNAKNAPPAAVALRPVAGRAYLRQDAAAELRRYVLESKLPPGARLPSEREIGVSLGLSRTSVREAMRYLEQEGLLEVRQGRPAVVRAFDLAPVLAPVVQRLAAERHMLRDLLAVRVPLELLAARLAASHRREENLTAMRACLARACGRLDAGQDALEEDVLFHDLLYQAAGNGVLLAFSRTVKDLLRAVREAAREVDATLERSFTQHCTIYEAVAAGDAAAATTAMARHMDTVAAEQRAALGYLDQGSAGPAGTAGRDQQQRRNA